MVSGRHRPEARRVGAEVGTPEGPCRQKLKQDALEPFLIDVIDVTFARSISNDVVEAPMTSTPLLQGSRAHAARSIAPPVSMLDRVTCILDLFDHPRRHLTLESISRRTGLPRSTAHRIMEHMISLRWLARTDAGYVLGPRVSGFARTFGDDDMLRAAAARVLHELSVATRSVVHLAMLEGTAIVYLDKVGGNYVDVPSRVGGRAPAVRTGLGMAMLATMTPEQVEAQLTGGGKSSERRGRFAPLHAELDKVRMRGGLAVERGLCVPSIACVATAVGGGDSPIGALSVVLGVRDDLRRIAPMVREAGRRATDELERTISSAVGGVPAHARSVV